MMTINLTVPSKKDGHGHVISFKLREAKPNPAAADHSSSSSAPSADRESLLVFQRNLQHDGLSGNVDSIGTDLGGVGGFGFDKQILAA